MASALLVLAAGCSSRAGMESTQAQAVPELQQQPEAASGRHDKPGWHLSTEGVAAAHPLAAQAGAAVLAQGGNALDAAIAAQLMLALVEPQSSGLGGGAFLLMWDGQQLSAWDGRETAPAAAHERMFELAPGQAMPMAQAVPSGLSVGVPGLLRMLQQAHAKNGRLPWAQLFEAAIAKAEAGFELTPRLHGLLQQDPYLRQDPLAAALYYDAQGQARPVGYRLRNPALAQLLRRIASQGADAFYTGAVAQDIVQRVRSHPSRPGLMSLSDLASYRAVQRSALCTDWRVESAAPWRVCGFPPPSSGHLTLMQLLTMLPASTLAQAWQQGVPGPDWLHAYTEAARLAYADRDRYIADPDFVAAPGGSWSSLLQPQYLRERAGLIGPRSMGRASAGVPAPLSVAWAPHPEQLEQGTSHISVVDREGSAVALTTTIEAGFGSRIMSNGGSGLPGGFLLNNQLTDFSLLSHDAKGQPVANRVQPLKRPRSSMSPTLVFDARSGRLLMTLGAPGGAGIIHYVAKALVGTHDWGLDLQRAVDLPNVASFNGPTLLEQGQFPPSTAQALRARGHEVQERELTSGLHGLQRESAGWLGAADPRREGVAAGR
ncbi:gamma-glutamyltransferase family protein [Roseateles sp. BYS180W]|uniref:Gamma-glutamyltransferase family protein n=1 Tax=Roseateles rivi TaxID=3299028 RepID=A0ABW7FYD6_9BURK